MLEGIVLYYRTADGRQQIVSHNFAGRASRMTVRSVAPKARAPKANGAKRKRGAAKARRAA